MIIEVTYEGNGIFKVWPAPDEQTAKTILTAIQLIDPSNAPEGSCDHGVAYRYACADCNEENEEIV